MTGPEVGHGEKLLQEFLDAVHATAPTKLPSLVDSYATKLGVRKVVVYLVDLQQRRLTPLSGESSSSSTGPGRAVRTAHSICAWRRPRTAR